MTATTCPPSGFEAVIQALAARTGLSFAPNRYDHAEAGIRRAMARAGTADPERYRELIENDAGLLDGLVNELTVGETYFFREPEQFEFIRRVWLPEIAAAKGEGQAIRVWSAGCASGEEAYSLAILLEQENRAAQAHLVATDISRAALAKARQATYSDWSLRGEGSEWARPYLTRAGDRWVLEDRIRRLVAFEYLNLALDVYPSLASGICGMDLILCRNVLIYFNAETIRQVARRLLASLSEGGCLVCGPSDPILTDFAPFQATATQAGLVYRRGKANAGNSLRQLPSPAPTWDRLSILPGRQERLPNRAPHQPSDSAQARAATAAKPQARRKANAAAAAARPADTLSEARQAFTDADYRRVITLTSTRLDDLESNLLHVQALANLDLEQAERICRDSVKRHPLAVPICYLHSLLLLQLGRDAAAVRAVRHVIYLDRSLAAAHFTLGSVLRRTGDLDGASRAYRNARDLAAARPADEVVPLSDGERAGRLLEAAQAQLALLESNPLRMRSATAASP